ncbi:transcription termination factor 3 mitochondrial [Phtheirospermum japonicum]|uniref:Transcription termination factor 3 mitochondrial n=1 Tax=Phtheirospermum japonicum TaxID=374723 RepID=A0A830CS02_9LAMI|nr:transcription termination factor 3 mitochondrial [Phtheirospermum japonicum]
MFAIVCRRGLRVPLKYHNLVAPPNADRVRSCSTSVCENVPEKSFTIFSYLVNSCGLSSKDAISASKKLCCIKSPEKPDAVLKLLREYGFTDAHHIPRVITGWPAVLLASPNKTLLPKLQFFRSIGVPLPVLAQKLSVQPSVLTRSLENSIIPLYNYLKSVLGLDERVIHVFTRSPEVFGRCWAEGVSSNVSMLRERGVPHSNIVSLVLYMPSVLIVSKDKMDAYVGRALEMGFDVCKSGFVLAIRVFIDLTESTLEQKKEVYRRCGWSESDIRAAFLKHPNCLKFSEKKIMANMNFLVNTLGCERDAIVQCPAFLGYSLDKRIKPRCLVAGILSDKGLKSRTSLVTLLTLSEEKFLKRYIVEYEKDIPELLDIYRGKSRKSMCR